MLKKFLIHKKINEYTFTLDCGSQRGALCGDVVTPLSYKDCSIYSTKKNSCCFYRYKYKVGEVWTEDTNCVWLGTPDVGEMSFNKLEIICSQNYIYLNILFLFIIFILYV